MAAGRAQGIRIARTKDPIDYGAWADFRHEIRSWVRISEDAAARFDIPPQHHQLLLAIAGFRGPEAPSISDLAERMQLRHHSIVGLLDRMELRGLVERHPTGEGRTLAIILTAEGARLLAGISRGLQPELRAAAERLIAGLSALRAAAGTRRPSRLAAVSSRPPGRRLPIAARSVRRAPKA